MILKTPMFRAVHDLDPEAEIDVMANNRAGAVDVIRGLPEIRNAYEFRANETRQRRKELAQLIRDNQYDVALIPMDGGPGWLRLILWRSPIPQKVQLCAVPGNRLWERAQLVLLHRLIDFVPWLAGRHEIDMNLDLVQALVKRPLSCNYQTSVSFRSDTEIVMRFGLPQRYVCLQVGAAEGLNTPKRWPMKNFSHLIRELGQRYPDLGLVTVGTQKEFELFVAPLMDKHPHLAHHLLHRNPSHAFQVGAIFINFGLAERADSEHAWSAGQIIADHHRVFSQGLSAGVIGGSIQSDEVKVQGIGNVHDPTVVGDHRLGSLENVF